MSRLQAHRKSHSTSALSVIASSSGSSTPARPRGSKERPRGLERVPEGSTSGTSVVAGSHGGRGSADIKDDGSRERDDLGRTDTPVLKRPELLTIGQAKGWLNEILSIRTPALRRLECLTGIEELLLTCCVRAQGDDTGLEQLVALNTHTNLLILLARHAQTLTCLVSQSHTSLAPTDEAALALVPELGAIFGLLQGFCLLSGRCKAACAEDWTMEMFVDLLLLLRAVPAQHTPSTSAEAKPVVYSILELFFCVLVDSPESARTFEKLSGLEAVTRVLKGSSVAKEVRMKCIEFLYFYLEPEGQPRSVSGSSSARSASSSTTGTSSSTSSSDSLYPPSPLDRTSYSPLRVSPIIASSRPISPGPSRLADLDVHFIPQTPRKKVTPNLGYLTPSSRRTSGSGHSGKTTPTLETVPASPVGGSQATPRASQSRRGSGDAGMEREVGLGLGLPMPGEAGLKRDVTAVHLGALTASPKTIPTSTPSSSARWSDQRDIQPSASSSSSSSSTASTSLTVTATTPTSALSKSSKMSRSSTQPNLAMPSTVLGHVRQSSMSVRRSIKSPLVHSSIPESPPTGLRGSGRAGLEQSVVDNALGLARSKIKHSRTSSQLSAVISTPGSPGRSNSGLPRIRHSATSSQLSSLATPTLRPSLPDPDSASVTGLVSGMRHSRTSSHLSALDTTPIIALPDAAGRSTEQSAQRGHIRHSRTSSHLSSIADSPRQTTPVMPSVRVSDPPTPSRSSSSADPGSGAEMERTPSKAKRAFPAALTKGSLPTTPNPQPKPTPLGHSRRVSSISDRKSLSPLPPKQTDDIKDLKRAPGSKVDGQHRSVQEKKELLGQWLGNVDALVQGVNDARGGWWSAEKDARGR